MRIKISKKRQAAIATIAGGALLLGAGGTYSLWTAEADITDNTIKTGHLELEAETVWTFTGPGDGRTWQEATDGTPAVPESYQWVGPNAGGTHVRVQPWPGAPVTWVEATHVQVWVPASGWGWPGRYDYHPATASEPATHAQVGYGGQYVEATYVFVPRINEIPGTDAGWVGDAATLTEDFRMIPTHTVFGTTAVTADLLGTGLTAELTVANGTVDLSQVDGEEIVVTWILDDVELGEGITLTVDPTTFESVTKHELTVKIEFVKEAEGTMDKTVTLTDFDVKLSQIVENY